MPWVCLRSRSRCAPVWISTSSIGQRLWWACPRASASGRPWRRTKSRRYLASVRAVTVVLVLLVDDALELRRDRRSRRAAEVHSGPTTALHEVLILRKEISHGKTTTYSLVTTSWRGGKGTTSTIVPRDLWGSVEAGAHACIYDHPGALALRMGSPSAAARLRKRLRPWETRPPRLKTQDTANPFARAAGRGTPRLRSSRGA